MYIGEKIFRFRFALLKPVKSSKRKYNSSVWRRIEIHIFPITTVGAVLTEIENSGKRWESTYTYIATWWHFARSYSPVQINLDHVTRYDFLTQNPTWYWYNAPTITCMNFEIKPTDSLWKKKKNKKIITLLKSFFIDFHFFKINNLPREMRVSDQPWCWPVVFPSPR